MPQPKKSTSQTSSKAKRSPSSSKRAPSPSKRTQSTPKRAQSASTAKRRPARRRSTAKRDPGMVGQVREALARTADSLNLLLLSRDRLQGAIDDAVSRGHMTREAANNLVADLVSRGRREIEDVLSDTDQLMGRVRNAPGADLALQQVDRARRAVGVGPSFPISGYDDLTAAQVTERLDSLSPADLRKVRDYERRHGNRKGVLAAVEKQLNA